MFRLYPGILFGAGAMAFMAIAIVLMRPLLNQDHVFWVTELRMSAALLALLVLLAAQKDRRQLLAPLWERGSRGFAFGGAIMGNLISMTLWVGAFKYTSVNSAAILNQTNTVFVVILAAVFLKDPLNSRRLLATALAVAGSLLVILS